MNAHEADEYSLPIAFIAIALFLIILSPFIANINVKEEMPFVRFAFGLLLSSLALLLIGILLYVRKKKYQRLAASSITKGS